MRVLMTTDAEGGVWTYSLDLARGLAKHGVETVLAVMGQEPSAEARREALRVPGLRLETGSFDLEWMPEPWRDVEAAGRWLKRLEEQHAPDVVHINGYAHGACGFKAPVVVVAHASLYGWWDAVRAPAAPPPQWEAYRRAVRAGLRGADRIVVPTRRMGLELARHFGPLSTRCCRIPNGRARFAAAGPKEDRVLWVGRLWDAANDVQVLDAAARFGLPWPVRAVGAVVAPEGARAPETPHVECTGAVPSSRLVDEYARAKVFVSTARYEPFGLSALEAAQAGCALVLPAIGTLRETWRGAAFFYQPRDARHLRARLLALMEDEAMRGIVAHRARDRAARLTHTRMAGAYLDEYTRLAQHRKKAALEVGAGGS